MPFYRRRQYRRNRRKHVSVFRYKPIHIYTHRFRNSLGMVSSSGFITVDDVKKNVIKNQQGISDHYQLNTTDFETLFPDFYAPTTKAAAGPPYFSLSEELVALLGRYSKYRLVSINSYMKNFKFLQVTCRVKHADVTDQEKKECQDYLAWLYDAHEGSFNPLKFVIDYDKFDIQYQYVDKMPIELLWRNHTCYSDTALVTKDVDYGAGDAPPKVKYLTNKSVLKQLYYPKCKQYLDSNDFFGNKYNNSFKYWLDAMGVTNYPNICYARPMMYAEQYIYKDINSTVFNCIMYDVRTYYKFKFAGMNNADVQ